MSNPIQYISRTFNTILNDINSDAELASKPNWFKRLWAGIGDVLSVWLNAIANNLYLRTAYTRGAVADLCELIDYVLTAHSTSQGYELFYVSTALGSAIYPFTVTTANLKSLSPGSISTSAKQYSARSSVTFTNINSTFTRSGDNLTVTSGFVGYTGHKMRFTNSGGALPTPLALNTDYYAILVNATTIKVATTLANAFAGNYVTLTGAGTGTHTATLYSKAVLLYQETALANAVAIGTSNGSDTWQEYELPDKFVLSDTLVITINSVTWTKVTTFVNSISTDIHYKLIPLADNQFSVRFGNGTYGAVPGNFDIYANYSYGGGASSNVTSLNRITSYAGSDANITGCTNATTFTDGADEQSIEDAKILSPLLLKARDRFVTVDDGEALVNAYPGISFCKIIENYYGLLSCKVIAIADGGGNPSPGLRSTIQQYLIDRSVLSSIDVRFVEATITTVAVTSAAKMLPGYTWTVVQPYFRLAYKLFLSEMGYEILATYNSEGVEAATTKINSYFTEAFTSADYTAIQKLLDGLTARAFGDVIQSSDIYAFVQGNIDGIDYMTIASFGTGLPMTFAADAISSIGSYPYSLTLTEIP